MKYNSYWRMIGASLSLALFCIYLVFVWLSPALAVLSYLVFGLFDAIVVYCCSILLIFFTYNIADDIVSEFREWKFEEFDEV